jgi:TonB family protein
VTVDTGGAVMHRSPIVYPEAARAKRIQGVVTVEATIDSSGNVVDTRVLSGPIELRRAAQQSVLNWHFAMDTSMMTRQVKVNFELPAPSAAPAAMATPSPAAEGVSRAAAEDKMKAMQALQSQIGKALSVPLTSPALEGKRVNRIYVGGLSDESRRDLMSHLQLHLGDILAADTLEKARAEVRAFDEHLIVGVGVTQNGEVSLNIMMPGIDSSGAGFGGVVGGVPAVPPPADGTKCITIGGNVQQTKLISQARPAYPPLAKQARIQGVVHLQAVIGKEGNVVNLAVISGHPLLVPSAIDAVQKWVYQTTLLNGQPVEVITQIDVNYTLSDEPPIQQ